MNKVKVPVVNGRRDFRPVYDELAASRQVFVEIDRAGRNALQNRLSSRYYRQYTSRTIKDTAGSVLGVEVRLVS
jgi:hypothetical protein